MTAIGRRVPDVLKGVFLKDLHLLRARVRTLKLLSRLKLKFLKLL